MEISYNIINKIIVSPGVKEIRIKLKESDHENINKTYKLKLNSVYQYQMPETYTEEQEYKYVNEILKQQLLLLKVSQTLTWDNSDKTVTLDD